MGVIKEEEPDSSGDDLFEPFLPEETQYKSSPDMEVKEP